jgi:hypothetical protein
MEYQKRRLTGLGISLILRDTFLTTAFVILVLLTTTQTTAINIASSSLASPASQGASQGAYFVIVIVKWVGLGLGFDTQASQA